MPTVAHIHTYIRHKNKPGYYRCNSPDCTYSIEKSEILGKLSRCNQCGNQIILSREDLRRAAPKCLNCSNTKKAIAHRKAQNVLDVLGTFSTQPSERVPSFLLPDSILDEEETEPLEEDF
jgi:hypothetical protein